MFNARVHILYINDSQAGYLHPTNRKDAVVLKFREIAPVELLEHAKITYAIPKGDLGKEIVKYSEENNIDLIINDLISPGYIPRSLLRF
jgi:nucleotide-binding universal stress UspA family protein